jgi:1-phosphofructokinase family hexose kinase
MIITLTPNTGIDFTVQIPWFQLHDTIRASEHAWGMAGKAADVSWILGNLGIPTRALGFAAGPIGQRMEGMLRQRGVETDFTWVEGESRLNLVIVVPEEGQSTITSSSLMVSSEHVADLMARYERALEDAVCVVMGGSLPAGLPLEFYTDAMARAHRHGVPVIFDSSGAALKAGMAGHPEVIKPNRAELGDLIGTWSDTRDEVVQAALRVHQEFDTDVIVTLGPQGAVAVFGDGAYFVHPLSIPVRSSAGAGDGVLAGIALAYLREEPLEYGLQHGFALAAAVLGTLPTADFRIEDYEALIPQIRIDKI